MCCQFPPYLNQFKIKISQQDKTDSLLFLKLKILLKILLSSITVLARGCDLAHLRWISAPPKMQVSVMKYCFFDYNHSERDVEDACPEDLVLDKNNDDEIDIESLYCFFLKKKITI